MLMRAAVIRPGSTEPSVEELEPPMAGAGEVVVGVSCAGINRNDVRAAAAAHELAVPIVPGSDACGTVVAVGDDIIGNVIGRRVVIDPGLDWGDDPRAPADRFEILGYPRPGTHAELVVVPRENVHPAPERLTDAEAAALPLAGVTAWRALVARGELRAGERVLVHGGSGGVATFAVQIAAALGAQVMVTTSSEEKLRAAVELGAEGGVVRQDRWTEELRRHGSFDLVLDSSGADWDQLLPALRRGGRLVALGRTAGDTASIDLHQLFWGQLDIRGTSMGSPQDFVALLDHVASSSWRPVVHEAVPLDMVAAAYRSVEKMGHTGKVVLRIATGGS
jgi:zinc-binding alcohol dehydrogenase/oxidoreductase